MGQYAEWPKSEGISPTITPIIKNHSLSSAFLILLTLPPVPCPDFVHVAAVKESIIDQEKEHEPRTYDNRRGD
jgi:hypothetical protein